MKAFEYIRIRWDMGDLESLNSLGAAGWRAILQKDGYVLLEREIPEHLIEANRQLIERNRNNALLRDSLEADPLRTAYLTDLGGYAVTYRGGDTTAASINAGVAEGWLEQYPDCPTEWRLVAPIRAESE